MAKKRGHYIKRKGILFCVLRGLVFAIAVTLILVILFSLLLSFVSVTDTGIMVVNQIIKVVSILFGILLVSHRGDQNAVRIGAFLGLLYMALGVLLFKLLSAQSLTVYEYFTDLLMGVSMGGLMGIVLSILKSKEEKEMSM